MLVRARRIRSAFLCLIAALPAFTQQTAVPSGLDTRGQVTLNGRSVPYLVRHLPVSSFPDLPETVQRELTKRGCLIPQTYEARRPENVIRGSFERAGSQDWAVLCSASGTVSLLVFFAGAPDKPVTLAASPETKRLQPHDLTGALGFNWGIDAATPEQVREAQIGMEPRPPKLEHDGIADSTGDQKTVYRYYAKNGWTIAEIAN